MEGIKFRRVNQFDQRFLEREEQRQQRRGEVRAERSRLRQVQENEEEKDQLPLR